MTQRALTNLHHHEGLAVSAERVLQQVCEAGVPEGHVWVFGAQGVDDVAQRRQWFVDTLSLTQTAALGAGFGNPLGTSQIHQIEFTCRKVKVSYLRLNYFQSKRTSCVPEVRWPVEELKPATLTIRRAWERELCSFRLVHAVALFMWPRSNTCRVKGQRLHTMH